ncbi:MAG: PAS domain S-box protein [Balneolaceae bacterium]|nr:PAS domain S-box protein [Balneolaceae bacterium]
MKHSNSMKKSAQGDYSNRFKAKLALQASTSEAIEKLSDEYSIPASKIEGWVREVEERAELLFVGTQASNETKAIHNYAALLRTTLEASPNGILVTDLNRNIITYNQKCVEMWEVPERIIAEGKMEEMVAYISRRVKDPEGFEEGIKNLYVHPDETINDIIELKNGQVFERHSEPYQVEGKTVGRVTNFVDITEFKQTEEKLAQYGNLLHSINTNLNEGILRSTPDDGLVYVNDAFIRMFGYDSKEEVLKTNPTDFYANEENRWQVIKKLKKENGIHNEEVLFRRKDGSTFWGLENSTMVESNGDKYIDAVVTDIDSRKKAEEELRKSEEKYRTILKNIEEGYFETNLAGDFTFFNRTLVEMIGYPADELIGKNNREYMDGENAQKVYETFNRVYQTGKPEHGFDWQLICGDGSLIFVEASVTLRKDEGGNPIGFSGMVRNVTDRKQKEKQIRNSLKEKEVLLGEIHHRVKNNLAVISGLLYLQADITQDENAQKALMQSQNRINSMALIHELLYDNQTFSSLNPRVYIEQLVEHISSNLRSRESSIKTEIKAENFDLEMSTAIPCALIINELITNAYKYAFTGLDEGTVWVHFQKTGDENYQLIVADNGKGLPADFSIEDSSNHSLGLSLVKTLTRQLKGELSVENGKGTTFTITFSAA